MTVNVIHAKTREKLYKETCTLVARYGTLDAREMPAAMAFGRTRREHRGSCTHMRSSTVLSMSWNHLSVLEAGGGKRGRGANAAIVLIEHASFLPSFVCDAWDRQWPSPHPHAAYYIAIERWAVAAGFTISR